MYIYDVITPYEFTCQTKAHQQLKANSVLLKTIYSFPCFQLFVMLMIPVTTTLLRKATTKRTV